MSNGMSFADAQEQLSAAQLQINELTSQLEIALQNRKQLRLSLESCYYDLKPRVLSAVRDNINPAVNKLEIAYNLMGKYHSDPQPYDEAIMNDFQRASCSIGEGNKMILDMYTSLKNAFDTYNTARQEHEKIIANLKTAKKFFDELQADLAPYL